MTGIFAARAPRVLCIALAAFLVGVGGATAAADVMDNLIGWWPLGPEIVDEAGNPCPAADKNPLGIGSPPHHAGAHGILGGAGPWNGETLDQWGVVRTVFRMNGYQHLTTIGTAGLNPDNSQGYSQFAITAWVKQNHTSYPQVICTKGKRDPANGHFELYIGQQGELRFDDASGATATTGTGIGDWGAGGLDDLDPSTGISLWDDKWHHVAVSYDGEYLRFYVDGLVQPNEVFLPARIIPAYDRGADGFNDIGARFRIGGALPDDPGNWMNEGTDWYHGWVDDVRVYGGSLTAAQVARIMPEPASLVLWALGGMVILRRSAKRGRG